MAYDEGLAERLREALQGQADITERKMFGGLAFLARGHMFVGILGDVLMARVGPSSYAQALALPYVREMDFTGKPMRGYVFVEPPGFAEDEDLAAWVQRCHRFVQSLPPKPAK
ncbi:TfoX/Sxy family protein [Pseudomonas lalucatii]|nr:TfoX/Sxy family protein [Pseudomonas lalucatii]